MIIVLEKHTRKPEKTSKCQDAKLKAIGLKNNKYTTKRIKTWGCVYDSFYENYMEKLYEKTNKQKQILKLKQKKTTF